LDVTAEPVVQWLQETFSFKAPEHKPKERSKKKSAWHLQFRGDFSSLDLIKLLEELAKACCEMVVIFLAWPG
jgi:hypothetical protein